jgi:hypothetical protein
MVGDGAGMKPCALEVLVGGAEEARATKEEARKPLQTLSVTLQVLNAHCSSRVQDAWKLPQRVWRPELVA